MMIFVVVVVGVEVIVVVIIIIVIIPPFFSAHLRCSARAFDDHVFGVISRSSAAREGSPIWKERKTLCLVSGQTFLCFLSW